MAKSKIATPKKPITEETSQKESAPELPTESTDICYTVSIPADGIDNDILDKIGKIVKSKETLLKKVFKNDELYYELLDGKLTFNWLRPDATQEEIHACMVLVTKIVLLAKNIKRVNSNEKEKDMPSEKYAFRCFLLRLGMIGKEYSKDRKVLLMNLTGSSSFKRGAKNE